MARFRSSIINEIILNLRDRYCYEDGFPILKELIQNADDADARNFIFGDHPGFPESDNPLLQGSGLYFYNNGMFKPSDKDSIASFAENAKAAEKDSIGKFGLGMKSVFHLCEAFFYVANDGIEIHKEVLNPWNNDSIKDLHLNWETVKEQEWANLEKVACEISGEDHTWFFLWIPLRQKRHLITVNGGETGSIMARFPGDDGFAGVDLSFLQENALKKRLAMILPLLRTLETISLRSAIVTGFSLSLESDGRLERDIAETTSTGKVYDKSDTFVLNFHGNMRQNSAVSLFDKLKLHSNWPKTYCLDEMGHQILAPDKSRPEGSVLICKQQSDRGKLSIQWALFLPLEESSHLFESTIVGSSIDYKIFIHGQFFVDAGRRGIFEYSQLSGKNIEEIELLDEIGLRRCWNQEIAGKISLPLFIPTLEEFVRLNDLGEPEINALTTALANAYSKAAGGENFLSAYKHGICDHYSWCKILEPESATWQKIDHRLIRRLLKLPAPPKSDPSRPWHVFPNLDSLGADLRFVDNEAPSLSVKLEQWTENDLLTVLREDVDKAFSSSTHLEYLSNFFECAVGQRYKQGSVQKIILSIVRKGFNTTHVVTLRQNRQKIINFLKFILPEFMFDTDSLLGNLPHDEMFSALWKIESDILLVPKDFYDKDYQGNAKIQKDDALSWLRALHFLIDSEKSPTQLVEQCLVIASRLLDKLSYDDRIFILKTYSSLKIIQVTDARTLKPIPVSYEIYERAKNRRNLFGFAQGTTQLQRAGLTKLLSAVVPEELILLTNAETFKMLYANSAHLSSAGSSEDILTSLGATLKTIGCMDARKEMIKHANNPGENYLALKGIRYLLHCDVKHFDDVDISLWVTGHNQSSAWTKLWSQVSQIKSDEEWNILSRDLIGNIPPNQWNSISINEINPSDVTNELSRIGTGNIISEPFNDSECEEILSTIADERIWSDLPLHSLKGGCKGRVDERTYLDAGKSLPPDLASSIQIVEKSRNSAIKYKQENWISPLDGSSIIQIALASLNPSKHWQLIIEYIEDSTVTATTHKKLKETAWLPLKNGGSVPPDDIINIDALSDDIQILASKADYCYAGVADLSDNLLKSSSLTYLKDNCFAKESGAIRMLGLLMADIPGYAIGEIDLPEDSRLVKMLTLLNKIKGLPGWGVIHSVATKCDEASCLKYLLPELLKPIQTDTIVSVLNELSIFAENREREADSVFNMYLHLFCKDFEIAKNLLPKIRLKSVAGVWKLSGALCYGIVDVAAEYLLDGKQATILADFIKDTNKYNDVESNVTKKSAAFDLTQQTTYATISSYFHDWKGLVSRDELIGAVIGMMGASFRKLSNSYLDPHDTDWLYNQIEWSEEATIIYEGGNKTTCPGGLYKSVWERLSVAAHLFSEDNVTVSNIVGKDIKVPLTKEINSIIAGSPRRDSGFQFYFPLRKINPNNFSSEALSEILKKSTRDILDKCYWQEKADLEALWQELEKTDQLKIDVVREMILEHLPFYLRQLPADHKNEQLRNVLANLDQARLRYQENKNSLRLTQKEREKLSSEIDVQREHISEILSKNKMIQKAVLEAVKSKMKDFQYELQSIPFEIFQNSDDAVVELGDFKTITSPARRLVIDIEGRVIRFMHWGRKINSNPGGDENRGFHRDLEKMLVLSSSDKPIGEGVTGKFGLGFKSVFLCCDRPRILSGDLHVEIVGGVLPQIAVSNKTTIDRLEYFNRKEDRQHYRGTVIELRINDDVQIDDLLKKFQQFSGLLTVFGRAIRKIIMSTVDNENLHEDEWSPEIIIEGVEFGKCEIPDKNGKLLSRHGLVFRCNSGVVFIVMSTEGFKEMDKSIPSIWVTAPTSEAESLGFAVSSDFSVDAGRGKLAAKSDKNIRLAEKIGTELGFLIVSLISRYKNNWNDAIRKLHLAENITLADFVASIWRTMSIASTSEAGTQICRNIAFNALSRLSQTFIPNGLLPPYQGLVELRKLEYKLSETWSQSEVIEQLKIAGIVIENCIASDIADLLKQQNQGEDIYKLDFSCLLKSVALQQCEESNAVILETIAKLVWGQLKDEEKSQASENLLFKSASGEWKSSKVLLCAGVGGDKEEELLVGFAPASSRLADSYSEEGSKFFKRCRPRRNNVNTDVLISWVLAASGDEQKISALQYLRFGDSAQEVCISIRKNGISSTWLKDITIQSELFKGWNDTDKDQLLRNIADKVIIENTFQQQLNNYTPNSTKLDPAKTLNKIYDWWMKHELEQIALYERDAFPGGIFPSLDFEFLKKEPEARKGWMTLFLLGAFHTVGWNTYEKNKRYINICRDNGWMDVFVTINDNRLNEWVEVIKDCISKRTQDVEYYQWMKEFISIFTIGYWLDDYVEGFLAINRMEEPFSLKMVTTQRVNSTFQGGGVDAPPIYRALGIGVCFVMRELVRNNHITNTASHKFCYGSRKPVREFLNRLGCDEINEASNPEERSKAIYNFLCTHLGKEKATFNNSFDLPILAVAKSENLQSQVFDYTLLKVFEVEEDDEYDQ
jgi:hypothetical protein